MASIEERLAALEERLGMESGLRASMDTDLASINSKLSAQHHLIQALSITQGEHTGTLAQVRETQVEHTASLRQIIDMLETLIRGNSEEGDQL